jgi:hypothetical protein
MPDTRIGWVRLAVPLLVKVIVNTLAATPEVTVGRVLVGTFAGVTVGVPEKATGWVLAESFTVKTMVSPDTQVKVDWMVMVSLAAGWFGTEACKVVGVPATTVVVDGVTAWAVPAPRTAIPETAVTAPTAATARLRIR